MNLQQLEEELDMIVEDGSLRPRFRGWVNDAILAVAADIELPALKLLVPGEVTVDGTSWIWPMPSNYQKKLFRCTYIGSDGRIKAVTVCDRRDDLEYRDHTVVGSTVNSVATAVQGEENFLLIDPLPQTETILSLWYYRKPTVLVDPEDVCDCIPEAFQHRVILPKVIARNYKTLVDQVVSSDLKSIAFWEGEYVKGLRGSPGDLGLVNYLLKTERPPRRTGGRDAVGWKWRGGR
jgi:hypothetical protein